MSDVRLVATNPEDSSVVPVAANNRGELLTVAPVIEKIPNDVEIDGQLQVNGGLVDANGDPIGGGGEPPATPTLAQVLAAGGIDELDPLPDLP